ncbi:MAG: F0F1 ATP synthase subunit B [Legionellaceae bacterium]|nr:F0F1 ATP synthase subunit B [Legionellaceae bacterium]
MDINATLIIQMLVFAAFVWFTMTFVWPPLTKALEERRDKVAEGLAAAERGQRELELAQERVKEELKQVKADAADIIEKAGRRASLIVDEAKNNARAEAERIAKSHSEQLDQEVTRAKEALREQVGALALAAAEKILMNEVDAEKNKAILDHLIEEL